MKGVIICNKCRKKMDGVCHCTPKGNAHCLIKIYWNGKHYEFRRNENGYIFTYDIARDTLIEISSQIKKETFNPVTFTNAGIKESKFEHQIDLWITEQEERFKTNELSWGTYRDYKGYVANYFHVLNAFDVKKIGLAEFTRVKDKLKPVSIKTRRNVMAALKTVFVWMKRRGTITKLPEFPEISGDYEGKPGQPIGYETQMEALQKLPEKDRDIILFLMETGLRPGEVCALLVQHFDKRQGTVRIERTFTGKRIRETTKQKRKRVIPLSDDALEIAARNAEGKHPQAFLFVNAATEKNYLPDTLWRIWHYHSGLSIRLYDATRHSFGTQLASENNLYQVSKLMGHSTIKMTEKYLNMKATRLRGVANSRKVIGLRTENRTEIEPKKEGNSEDYL